MEPAVETLDFALAERLPGSDPVIEILDFALVARLPASDPVVEILDLALSGLDCGVSSMFDRHSGSKVGLQETQYGGKIRFR